MACICACVLKFVCVCVSLIFIGRSVSRKVEIKVGKVDWEILLKVSRSQTNKLKL